MIDFVRFVLEQAGEHVTLVLACVLLFAAVDAALGVGAILPGETAIVFAAVALSDNAAHVALAVAAAAAGAFIGDHIGFAVGRRFGPRLGDTKFIHKLGRDNWDRARSSVARRFWIVIVARLMPGIRTLVSAAAGASTMPYRRYAFVCALATTTWATIWVIGGAIIGSTLLEIVDQYTFPAFAIAAAVVVAGVIIMRRRALTS